MTEKYNFPRLRSNYYSQIVCMIAPDTITLDPISGTQINVYWDNVSNADGYFLERATSADFSNAVEIYAGGNTSYIDTGLSLDTTYYYRVLATKLTYCNSSWREANITTITPESNETDFLTYSFPQQVEAATIDTYSKTIDIEVVQGTDITMLIASFTLSLGATAQIYPVEQTSGSSQNDFTNPITYTVTAEDGVTQTDWIITVTEQTSTTVITIIAITGSGNLCRVAWAVEGAIPATFKIERQENGGSWTTVDAAFSFTDLTIMDTIGMSAINRNFEYVDTGLNSGSTYAYKISGTQSNSIVLNGTVYYVKNGGNDGNTGLSDGQAWATVSKANGARSAGDLVLFNRGDTFSSVNTSISNKGDGTASNPVRWGAYGAGAKPILQGSAAQNHVIKVQDVRYWEFDNLHFQTADWQTIRIYANSRTTEHIKFLNCYVRGPTGTQGLNGCIHLNELNASVHYGYNNWPADQILRHIEIGWCETTLSNQTGISVWACTEGVWIHNCWSHNNSQGVNPGSMVDINGGKNHTIEYSYLNIDDDANAEGTKCHGQQHPIENVIYRRNLIVVDNDRYCLSVQDAKNCLAEFNTCWGSTTGFGAFSMRAKNRPQDVGGNIVRNNIFVGSRGGEGATRIVVRDYMEANTWGVTQEFQMGTNWYTKVDFENNCHYETSGYICKAYDSLGTYTDPISSNAEFVTEWNGNYAYPTDINEDPQFTDAVNDDFTTSNANVSSKGYLAVVQSEFHPQDLSPIMHCNGNVAGSIHEDDAVGRVSQWDDQSGSANHLAQSTPANQPTAGATFVNIDDLGWLVKSLSYDPNWPLHVFLRIYHNGTPTGSDWLFGFKESGDNVVSKGWGVRLNTLNTDFAVYTGDGTNQEIQTTPHSRSYNTWVDVDFVLNQQGHEVVGVPVAETNNYRGDIEYFILGNGALYSEFKCDVSFNQVLIYKKVLSSSERSSVLNWMSAQ